MPANAELQELIAQESDFCDYCLPSEANGILKPSSSSGPKPMTTPHQAIARIVDVVQPSTLLVCGALAEEAGKNWKLHNDACHLITLTETAVGDAFPLPETQDLALITGVLEHLSRDQGELFLGQLRNYGTHQIAVVVEPAKGWNLTDFIALGFRRQAELSCDGKSSILYTYNLDTYNHKRAWNNPDNWANPEMWGKAWW
ncbi:MULTISPECIES: DUF6231 family protein [Marinobacter]|jgi:hypothetical protein|uniref:DUF6231 family protein n=1 Tax=Marinobacter TaxID=2742 RepID=UPI0023579D5B|nr:MULTISPECIES: DUF6231 family protein [Marinobacter]